MTDSTGTQDTQAGTYRIETWGCQMNVHDSEKLAGNLDQAGYSPAGSIHDADIVLLNTCSIREKAAEKMFSELGRLRKLKSRKPDLILGVCGCVGQQEGEEIFRRAPFVDLVIGPRATASLPTLLDRVRNGETRVQQRIDTELRRDSIEFPFENIRRDGIGSGKAFITVIEGCNHRCTFCIVPTTRGREINRPMTDILAEVRTLAESGIMEVEFLGQTVNAFRDEEGKTLADLLRATSQVDGIERIRFTTSHPCQMTDALIDAMADPETKVAPFLNLPVQSGSDEVLKDMRRGYDRKTYLKKILSLRNRIPGISLGTDIIVGFPTETEVAFKETLALLTEVRFVSCYSFTYSPRPGTAAEQFHDQVPAEEKHDRLLQVQSLQKKIQESLHRTWVGRIVEVLVEGPSRKDHEKWTGRTPEHRIVNFTGDSTAGIMEKVLVESSTAYSLSGRKILPEA
jgi:tRNA-2-methylthio-N6-dimethylallyladenosine synthase